MTQKLDLMNQRFGKLVVTCSVPNVGGNDKDGRTYPAWLCQCDCGKTRIVRTAMLRDGSATSCGCTFNLFGLSLKPGQKINRLTMVKYQGDSKWLCQCDCERTTVVGTCSIVSGNTKSCGCLKSEINREPTKLRKFTTSNKQFKPHIASARRLWKQCCYNDRQCDLTFERWYDISKRDCFYCGTAPYNNFNCFLGKKEASQEAKDNGFFSYNGLDRIDNTRAHVIDNVVPCCIICNRAKSDRIVNDFYEYIGTLKTNEPITVNYDLLPLPTSYLLVSVKIAYRYYVRNYETMEIDLQTFYTISRRPCHYCEAEKSNYFNVYLKDKRASQTAKDGAHFHYNGIDRVDNGRRHCIENIVPCCYHCNFAKSDLSLPEFQDWIRRIQQFQETKRWVQKSI